MESIKELREICQASRRSTDNWHMKHIARKPSIYVTWFLLHTSITANGVTLIMTIMGLIAGFIFMSGTKLACFAGAMVLELWYIMDMVDGEIARYRKQSSLTGVYFDCLSHYIVHPWIFLGIGLGLYKHYGNIKILLLSMLAGYSVCMITLLTDVFYSVLYFKLSGGALVARETGIAQSRESGILKRAFSILHLLCTFPSIMNVIFLLTLVNLFVPFQLMGWLITFYAFLATLIWVARAFVFIKTRKIDSVLLDKREKE